MKNAAQTMQVLKKLRAKVDTDMTVQKAIVFLLLAEAGKEGMSQAEVLRRGDLTRAATSRNILDLSDLTSRKAKGPGLVDTRQDLSDRRNRYVFLTPKGLKVAKEVLA